jgi:hypothetical protein
MPAERRGAITGSVSLSSVSPSTRNMASSGFGFGAAAPATPAFGSTPAPAFGAAPAPAFGAAPAPAFGAAPAPAFGAAPAPAPAGGGFGFGGSTPAPASGGFGGFGSPAPAPSSGGFGFGGPAPAPSSGLFGAPAPAGGGLYGSTPAPASGGFGFGSPTPAPGAFGAPSSGSLYGAPSPSSGGGLFGAPAPTPGGFGAPAYGAPAPAYGAPQQPPPPAISGNMPYSQLPPDQKQAIDALHNAMMEHKRTLLQVSSMAPKLLQKPVQQADAAAGQELPLVNITGQLTTEVNHLLQQLKTLQETVQYTQQLYEQSTLQAFMFAKWPTEAVASRRGITLTKAPASSDPDADMQAKLQQGLDRQLAFVDRVELMPSPYLWQTLEDMEQRLQNFKGHITTLQQQLDYSKRSKQEDIHVTSVVQMQNESIWKLASQWTILHNKVEQVKNSYRMYEKGDNILDLADQAERDHQQQMDHALRLHLIKTVPTGPAPAPAGVGLYGSTPASGGLFGSTPAPAGGGLFGAPSPGPTGGGLFGAPAPAPVGGGLFGASAPAQAATGAFGAPAPAPGGGLFGVAAPAGGGIVGAPAPTPAFGAPAPAAGGFSFGGAAVPAPTPSVSTPKSKNKGRSTRRR